MDIVDALGPLSRIICLGVMCIWAPVIVFLYLQSKIREWTQREKQPPTAS